MASTNRESVTRDRFKRALLLGFVGISIALIGLVWADGVMGDQPATPSYYRDSFQVDPSVYLTVTAEAIEFENQLKGTPVGEDQEQHGAGQGRGQGRNETTTTATPTPEATTTP